MVEANFATYGTQTKARARNCRLANCSTNCSKFEFRKLHNRTKRRIVHCRGRLQYSHVSIICNFVDRTELSSLIDLTLRVRDFAFFDRIFDLMVIIFTNGELFLMYIEWQMVGNNRNHSTWWNICSYRRKSGSHQNCMLSLWRRRPIGLTLHSGWFQERSGIPIHDALMSDENPRHKKMFDHGRDFCGFSKSILTIFG